MDALKFLNDRSNSYLPFLRDISNDELKKLIESIDLIFFDVDGVLVLSSEPIPGAGECVSKLRGMGKQIGIVTNNTFSPLDALKKKLSHCDTKEDEINTPNTVLVSYLRDIKFTKDIYLIGSTLLKNMLTTAGFNVIAYKDIQKEPIGESYDHIKELIENVISSCQNVGAVILCFDFNFHNQAAQVATSILQHNPDVLLLSGLSDDAGPLTDKFTAIHSKYYIDGIQRWTNRECIEMAKPGLALRDVLFSKYNITDPSRVLFIGDSLDTDIAFGKKCRFKTLLVLSGITRKKGILDEISPIDKRPDYIAESLGELLLRIIKLQY